MASNATTRVARVAAGKCTVCLRRRASQGHPTCGTCRGAIAVQSAVRYAERRARGVCARCEAPAAGYLCEVHRDERNARRQQRDWR